MKKRENTPRRRRPLESNTTSFRCRECQLRRVKCDGTQPACNKCTSSGRVCPGYKTWEIALDTSISQVDVPDFAQPQKSVEERQHSILLRPSSPLSNAHVISDGERNAFDYFRHRICYRYIERGYPILWAANSIALGPEEPAVFFATASLSVMEQSALQTFHTSLARPLEEERRASAIQMYSKAITCLREPMQKAIRENGPLEPIILCCILFLVLEVTAGNHLNAMRHARVGKSILDERISRTDDLDSTTPTSSSLSPALQTIRRLWTEASASNPFHPTPRTASPLSGMSFASLEETRSLLEVLIEAGQNTREELIVKAQELRRATAGFADTATQFCLTHTFSRTMPIASSLQTRLNEIMNGFSSWGRRFAPMYRSGEYISQDLFSMQLRFFYASFTLAMCRANNERLADCFGDQFVRTLDSAERLLKHRPLSGDWCMEPQITGPVAIPFMQNLTRVDSGQSPEPDEETRAQLQMGLSDASGRTDDWAAGIFEFGILHALFTVACRCRTSYLRRRAIQLLSRAKRREAINCSQQLAVYAETIMHLEEQQARQLAGLYFTDSEFFADEMPEHARFLDIVAHPSAEDPQKFALTCTRHVSEHGNDIELLIYECSDKKEDCRLVQSIRSALS